MSKIKFKQDAAKEILACDPEVRVVISSGCSNSPLMAFYQDYGFCGAIVKPSMLQRLSGVIEKALTVG